MAFWPFAFHAAFIRYIFPAAAFADSGQDRTFRRFVPNLPSSSYTNETFVIITRTLAMGLALNYYAAVCSCRPLPARDAIPGNEPPHCAACILARITFALRRFHWRLRACRTVRPATLQLSLTLRFHAARAIAFAAMPFCRLRRAIRSVERFFRLPRTCSTLACCNAFHSTFWRAADTRCVALHLSWANGDARISATSWWRVSPARARRLYWYSTRSTCAFITPPLPLYGCSRRRRRAFDRWDRAHLPVRGDSSPSPPPYACTTAWRRCGAYRFVGAVPCFFGGLPCRRRGFSGWCNDGRYRAGNG